MNDKKVDAVISLMRDARSERMWTNTAVRRVVGSLKKLGIEGQELWYVLQYLDIADFGTGTPYQKSIVRTWP